MCGNGRKCFITDIIREPVCADFVRLAESYGAKGIRVTKPEEIENAFEAAKRNTKTPTLIEFIIGREMNVLPIVPPGNALSDMILESKKAE